MKEEFKVLMDFVANEEDVARMLFSPLFICDGILSQKTFTLEAAVKETYISVLRTAVDSFKADMEGIRKEGNTLYDRQKEGAWRCSSDSGKNASANETC